MSESRGGMRWLSRGVRPSPPTPFSARPGREPCSVRILTVDAGQQLSFQRHLCRDELFVALDSNVGVDLSSERLDGGVTGEFDSRIDSVTLAEGDYLLVSRGTWHRIRGQRARVRVLEVSFGIYDEDFDIDRLLDRYGRADFSG
jgi:mannose-6-phosphate isomerase-like protein (cupin superfamily)